MPFSPPLLRRGVVVVQRVLLATRRWRGLLLGPLPVRSVPSGSAPRPTVLAEGRDRLLRGILEEGLSVSVTRDQELALVQPAVVCRAEADAVASGMFAILGAGDQVVDVDIAAAIAARDSAAAAVAHEYGAADRCGEWSAALDGTAFAGKIDLAGTTGERRGGRWFELERADARVELAFGTGATFVDDDRTAGVTGVGGLIL